MNEKKNNKEDMEEYINEKMKERPTVFTKLILIFEFGLFLFSLFFLIIGLKVFLGVFLMGSFLFFLVLTFISLIKRHYRTTFWLPITFIPCIALLIAFIAIVNIPFGSSTTQETDVEEASEQSEAIEEPAPEEKIVEEAEEFKIKEAEIGSKENPYSINENITINNEVNWKILSAEDLGDTLEAIDRWSDDKTTTGKFIKVRFTVKNVSKEMKTLTDLRLFDNEDREFVTYDEIFGYIEDEEELFLLDNINPGMEGTYTVIYEVPADSKGFILEVTNLEFMSDKAYISLGF